MSNPVANLLFVNGVPSNSRGMDGNTAIDIDSGDFYQKESGAWVLKMTGGGGGVLAATELQTDERIAIPDRRELPQHNTCFLAVGAGYDLGVNSALYGVVS